MQKTSLQLCRTGQQAAHAAHTQPHTSPAHSSPAHLGRLAAHGLHLRLLAALLRLLSRTLGLLGLSRAANKGQPKRVSAPACAHAGKRAT